MSGGTLSPVVGLHSTRARLVVAAVTVVVLTFVADPLSTQGEGRAIAHLAAVHH